VKRYTRRLALGAVICLCFAIVAVMLDGKKRESGRKYYASDFFSDAKVAELAEAARDGNVELVDALVSERVDVNSNGKKDLNVLIYSMSGKNLKGFKRLLEHGANPNQQTDSGDSVMHHAAARKDTEALELSLAHGGNPNLRDTSSGTFDPTPVFCAVRGYSVENARILIKAGADLNAKDKDGDTLLMCAAMIQSYDVMYLLLEAGADFRAKNSLGYTVTNELLDNGVIVDEAFAGRVDRKKLPESKQKCMDFLRKKGVDFEQEKIKNAEIAKKIQEEEARKRGGRKPDMSHFPPY
jgi:uncharacterized protein